MDQLKKDLSDWPPGYLSRQHIERIKQTIPDGYQCVSCGEKLPDSHYLGMHNAEKQWEPFCKECFDVTMAIRKSEVNL
jgi:hypothetical protein